LSSQEQASSKTATPSEPGAPAFGPAELAAIRARTANIIRGLAMDAIQTADSGHPGMPMGMADIAAVLWGEVLKHDPSDPAWPDRDRVILSNGHGSMLLYAMLHLTGTALTLDDLKRFRQWGSVTAGHPEYGEAPGIETTTGPLGQGFANGVGMAIAERWLAARFGGARVDHHTYVLTGDGCLMEGISGEAASLAGHLKLGKLIVLWDDNRITIDGSTELSFTEDVAARFRAYGWQVLHLDGHDPVAIRAGLEAAKAEGERPTLLACRTTIGFGAPTLAGTSKSHGAPLGKAEVAGAKRALGLDPEQHFHVDPAVTAWLRSRDGERRAARLDWEAALAASPDKARWDRFFSAPDLSAVAWPTFPAGGKLATRKAGQATLQALAAGLEGLLGGSADLAESNGTHLHGGGDITGADFTKRNLNFGIREHAMAGICNGLALHGGVQPFCATFLTFHDYMRPSVRLSALMHLPVIYVYTHDSVFLGEDGPTHQPIEQIMSMRTMPNLWVIRPADAAETALAWRIALERRDGPTALCLTRQNLPIYDRAVHGAAEGALRGGYVLSDSADGAPDVVLIGTGSEVGLAMSAQAALLARGVRSRVVSLPCWELFARQDRAWIDAVLPKGVPRVSIEAGVTFGWERFVGANGASVGIDRFGASAPGEVVASKLGLNVENVVGTVERVLALPQ
jgi:transketolase